MRAARVLCGLVFLIIAPLTAAAQGLILFPESNYGRVNKSFEESAFNEAQLEILMGKTAMFEPVAELSASNIYRRLGQSVAMLDLIVEDRQKVRHNTVCTATRIARDLLMTNYHCVPGRDFKTVGVQARFGFLDPQAAPGQLFGVDAKPVESSAALDYAILKLTTVPSETDFPPVALKRHVASDGESLILIHHPMGQAQRLTRFRCQAGKPAFSEGRLVHHCDTLGGSSGSAVFTLDGFAFAGLHFAGVPNPDRPFNVAKPAEDLFKASATLRGLENKVTPEPRKEPDPVPTPPATTPTRRPGEEFRDPFRSGGGEGPVMVVLPKGRFTMGSPAGEVGRDSDEGPQRIVEIGYTLAVGKYEVSWAEYAACVADKACAAPADDGFGKGSRPVTNVSWDEARTYTAWLSQKTGQAYRLLSEAEWEYAARAGSQSRWSFGDDETRLGSFGWYSSNSKGQTQPVGTKTANAFGLYDMHGNVWEWVEDCYEAGYSVQPSNGSAYASGSCANRVIRGGAWNYAPQDLRSAIRNWFTPGDRFIFLGFRLARTLPD